MLQKASVLMERAFRDILFICLQFLHFLKCFIFYKTVHFVQNVNNFTFITNCTKSYIL